MHSNYLSLIKTIALCRKNKQRVKKKTHHFTMTRLPTLKTFLWLKQFILVVQDGYNGYMAHHHHLKSYPNPVCCKIPIPLSFHSTEYPDLL